MSDDTLSQKEQEILKEFRERVGHKVRPEMSSDFELSRWLIARNFNVDKSEAMLLKSLEWRKEWNIDNISEWTAPEVIQKYYPVGIIGYDKEGSTVAIMCGGNLDIRGMISSATNDDIIRYTFQIGEKIMELLRNQSRNLGRPIGKGIMIIDLEDFALTDFLYKPALDLFLKLVQMYEANYPETMKLAFGINAPFTISIAFNLIKPFLHTNTLQKIKIHGKTGWKEDLLKVIDADQLPVHWGGSMVDPDGNTKCISKVCIGGKIPTKYHLKNKELQQQNENLNLAFKKSLTLPQKESKIFEFQVENNMGSKIRWEFRSTGSDIGYELTRIISEEEENLIPMHRANSQIFKEEGELLCDEKGLYKIALRNDFCDKNVEVFYNIDLQSLDEKDT